MARSRIDLRLQLKAHLLQHTAEKRIFVIAITSQAQRRR
jgi:hypothetical protein